MLGTTRVRSLTAEDIDPLRALLDRDPMVNLFVRSRVESTAMRPRWLGGQIWGYFEHDRLISACHAGANIVPVGATGRAVAAFADQALSDGVKPMSIVGLSDAVTSLWSRLEPTWGPARSPRLNQPFMVIDRDAAIDPDPRVRPVVLDEFDTLYPACVAMFTEEVGVSPELGGRSGYRARVAQLITQGWAFAIIEDGEVLFKAEVAAATAYGCQIQGVWVRPDRRGEGLCAPALAAVVDAARARVAPVVSLYVNDHNEPARKAYERIGFTTQATFASILL